MATQRWVHPNNKLVLLGQCPSRYYMSNLEYRFILAGALHTGQNGLRGENLGTWNRHIFFGYIPGEAVYASKNMIDQNDSSGFAKL